MRRMLSDIGLHVVWPEERSSSFQSPRLQARVVYLQKMHGSGRWRKLKGAAQVRLPNGKIRRVELHWYEAHGIGRKDVKIKRYLD